MNPTLHEIPKDAPIIWQWLDRGFYLAGFANRGAAEWYGRLHGWLE
jgi:hypothetical protein